jgi:hypothetical protein
MTTDYRPGLPGSGGPPPDASMVPFDPGARNFIIVYGDRGLREFNMGRIFELSARTHEREVRANSFPGVPEFRPTDQILNVHCSSVTDLRLVLSVGNVVYLAYFGHSLNEGMGALLIGQDSAPDTNLTNSPGPNNTPVTTLSRAVFRSNALIRLFGCRGAYGRHSIAEQMANHLDLPVFGYKNDGGSIGTEDYRLGHGLREATRRDVDSTLPGNPRNVWMVPADGVPTFKAF